MNIGEHDCCNTLGATLAKSAEPYKEIEVVTRLHLEVKRASPMPWEEGTDYADYYYVDLPYEVKVEPGLKAWSIFEQAVLECMEIVHDVETGPEIEEYWASVEHVAAKKWYCRDLERIEDEQRTFGNHRGSDAVKEYNWFCVPVAGESCHHGNGWHSGCADCDQEENEVK